MNKTRANKISKANGLITEALELLRDALDGEEESLEKCRNPDSERYEKLEENVGILQEAVDALETVEGSLYDCYEEYVN